MRAYVYCSYKFSPVGFQMGTITYDAAQSDFYFPNNTSLNDFVVNAFEQGFVSKAYGLIPDSTKYILLVKKLQKNDVDDPTEGMIDIYMNFAFEFDNFDEFNNFSGNFNALMSEKTAAEECAKFIVPDRNVETFALKIDAKIFNNFVKRMLSSSDGGQVDKKFFVEVISSNLDAAKQCEYKARYSTFSERCDIYVPFFERSLSLLSERGVFSFICSNRFVRSSYGKRLRRLISRAYHVALYLNMEHTQPFEKDVSAYPAIYVIDRRIGRATYSGEVSSLDGDALDDFRTGVRRSRLSRFDRWYGGEDAWVTTSVDERDRFEFIAQAFPTIEKSGRGTQIGIGVASGADDVYVDPQRSAEIEDSCLLPLVASEDIRGGRIEWNARYMLNPYDLHDDRKMLDLSSFPKAGAYLNRHADRLKMRYCARKHPDAWYRTLDRISYETFKAAKILLPDIQAGGNVALDERGEYYPHHNVYWITSRSWDMKALCVLLRSSFVTDQIRRLSVQMRGGSIRYQAQNLRQVHIPAWSSLGAGDVKALSSLYTESDSSKIDRRVEMLIRKVEACQPPKTEIREFDFAM